jgi:hypothetical protein
MNARTLFDAPDDLTGYKRTEWEFPELSDLPTFSAAWYRRWRDLHLAKYPDLDQSSRDNFDMFIDRAERAERGDA